MRFFGRHAGALLAACGYLIFFMLVPPLYERQRQVVSIEMHVAIPRFAQVLMTAGDRYLAANLAGFRALLSTTDKMTEDEYRILGIVQSDVAWFNPAHEDNYYIAAAILPWNGELLVAQEILKKASEARPGDFQPAFYHAFNLMHFMNQPAEGALWLHEASRHTEIEIEKIHLQQLAARWVARGQDPDFAVRLHRLMAKEARSRAFGAFLEKRAQRLENMASLEKKVREFHSANGELPVVIDDLIRVGLISIIPADPFGGSYVLDRQGKVMIVTNASAQKK